MIHRTGQPKHRFSAFLGFEVSTRSFVDVAFSIRQSIKRRAKRPALLYNIERSGLCRCLDSISY